MELFFGLVGGSVFDMAQALRDGLLGGLFFGSILGLLGGLFFGGFAVIQHFTLRLILFLKGHLPWNLADFLDDATDRIFLYKAGGGYIFIHPLLQDYFASLETDGEVGE